MRRPSAEARPLGDRLCGDYLRLDDVSPTQFEKHVAPLYAADPEGLVFHTIWEVGGEVRVYDVWSSEQARDQFADRLTPALMKARWPYLDYTSGSADSTPPSRVKGWAARLSAALDRRP